MICWALYLPVGSGEKPAPEDRIFWTTIVVPHNSPTRVSITMPIYVCFCLSPTILPTIQHLKTIPPRRHRLHRCRRLLRLWHLKDPRIRPLVSPLLPIIMKIKGLANHRPSRWPTFVPLPPTIQSLCLQWPRHCNSHLLMHRPAPPAQIPDPSAAITKPHEFQ